MSCGFQWEDSFETYVESDSGQCEGHHECVLQKDHEDAEHECDCGDVATEGI